jgi:hypothetical protein
MKATSKHTRRAAARGMPLRFGLGRPEKSRPAPQRVSLSSMVPAASFLVATVASGVAVLLFAAYQTYANAYTRELGLVGGTFKPSLHEAIYSGFLSGYSELASLFVGVLLAGVLVSLMAFAIPNLVTCFSKKIVPNRGSPVRPKVDMDHLTIGFYVLAAGLISLLFLFALGGFLSNIEEKGRDAARRLIEQIDSAASDPTGPKFARLLVREGSSTRDIRGYVLTCNLELACAVRFSKVNSVVMTKDLINIEFVDHNCGRDWGQSTGPLVGCPKS